MAVLSTRRAPGLAYLLGDDPNRGRRYEIVVGLVTEPVGEAARELEQAGVPCAVHNLRAFCRTRGGRIADPGLRREFDARSARFLRTYRPDLVVLAGYLHILSAPMLEAFPGSIINIHDADLSRTDRQGIPRYRGLHSTRDALAAGEPETRSTVHLVTEQVDGGPLLLRSEAFPAHPMVRDARAWGAADIVKAYAYAQREWMMRASWGPLLGQAIELFASEKSAPARVQAVGA